MSIQNNTAVDVYQNFVLPTALDSDFSNEDLADDTGEQIIPVEVKVNHRSITRDPSHWPRDSEIHTLAPAFWFC